jgi:alkanesulfonate monooxygenase SsuD/methylene tetrahydromethanopterin reductase-like flavin-dependent oxidoreductase (luciferase family)
MRFGIYSPAFGAFSDPRVLADLAHEAEESGWDGYFLWDHVMFSAGPVRPPNPQNAPMADPWVTLAAMAMTTSRIRLGPVVTPVARRRPWKLAREAVSLDILAGGRAVLGVGIGGDQYGREFSAFGEPPDDHTHAEMLDEGLEVITGLWSGEPFSYQGKHYHVDNVQFLPRPVQQPRIPIWVAGNWPNKKPFRRAARWDGVAAGSVTGRLTPDDYREMATYINEFRTSTSPFDIVRTAMLPPGEPGEVAEAIAEYEQAGVTWWLVPLEDDMGPIEELRARIHKGPPR